MPTWAEYNIFYGPLFYQWNTKLAREIVIYVFAINACIYCAWNLRLDLEHRVQVYNVYSAWVENTFSEIKLQNAECQMSVYMFCRKQIEGLGMKTNRHSIVDRRWASMKQTRSLNFCSNEFGIDSDYHIDRWKIVKETNCTGNAINIVCLHVISRYRFIVSCLVGVCLAFCASVASIFFTPFLVQNLIPAMVDVKTAHAERVREINELITCAPLFVYSVE